MSEVFRVEKTRDFTVMSNRHLRDRRLSLKSKGLLSLILSLPDNWEYSVKGFSKLGPDGQDSIRTALKELSNCGYIEIKRRRDEKGRLSVSEYTIYEVPKQDNPDVVFPDVDKQTQVNPAVENPPQLSTEAIITEEENTEANNHQSLSQERKDMIDEYRTLILYNISYDDLVEQGYNKERLDEIVEIITECVCSSRSILLIGQEEVPQEIVKSRMMKLNASHIEYIFESMDSNSSKIRNIKAYLKSVIYNSVITISSYYSAEANHDLYGKD